MKSYGYQSLKQTGSFDFRSSFTFSGQKKPLSSETQYSDISVDLPLPEYADPRQAWVDFCCTSFVKFLCYFSFVATFPFSALVCLKLAHQYERIVIYRLGRIQALKGPGIVLVLPCIDVWRKVDMRTKAFNIPPTRICTTDRCLAQIGGVIHYRVQNPLLTSNSVQNMNHSIRVAAQSAMSSHLSKKKLPELMSNRQRFNYDIQVEINDIAREWGIEVGRVELSQPSIEVNPTAANTNPMCGGVPQFGGGDTTMAGLAHLAQQFLGNKQPDMVIQEEDGETLSPEDLLNAAYMFLTEELVQKVGATYEITISNNEEVYYIDLKYGQGSCGKGGLPSGADPDVTLRMSNSTLSLMLSGKLRPFSAYSSGKLKLQGDMKKAMKLDELIKCLKE